MTARLSAICVLILASLAPAAPAQAAFPGANGRVVFWDCIDEFCGSFYTANPDGSDRTRLIQGHSPVWSPDGKRIAFDAGGQISTVNADGTGLTNLAPGFIPNWSPDGTRLVFNRVNAGGTRADLWVMNADGSDQRLLLAGVTARPYAQPASWSPDGGRIAFGSDMRFPTASLGHGSEIYTVNSDGTGLTRLNSVNPNSCSGPLTAADPDWSPDGRRIAYDFSMCDTCECGDAVGIAIMNADGTGDAVIVRPGTQPDGGFLPAWSPDGTKIAFESTFEIRVVDARPGATPTFVTTGDEPDWQPIPQSYARPRGASPFQVSLVPAYRQCTTPNRTHGSPLAFDSCAPAAQASTPLTVGTPDSNGRAATTIATVGYTTMPGPGDVRINAHVTGVLTKPALAAYNGELSLDAVLRITDRNNTPNPGGPGPATVQDASFPLTVPCASGACSVATTANAVTPGAVLVGKRAIWELGQVKLYDGGADGVASTTGDNTLFMVEGVFVP